MTTQIIVCRVVWTLINSTEGLCWIDGHLNFDVTVRMRRSYDDDWIKIHGPRWPRPPGCPSVRLSHPASIIIAIIIITGMRSNHWTSAADVWWPVSCSPRDLFHRTVAVTDDEPASINKIKQLKDNNQKATETSSSLLFLRYQFINDAVAVNYCVCSKPHHFLSYIGFVFSSVLLISLFLFAVNSSLDIFCF